MRCDLFKNIKDDLIDETYNYEYVNYLIVKAIFLCNEKKCSLDYLVNYFENIYGTTIKSSKLKKYLIDSFEKNGVNNFIISEDEKVIMNFILLLEDRIKKLTDESEDKLYSELYKYIEDDSSKFIDIYSYFAALEIVSNSNLKLEIVLSQIYSLLHARFINKDEYSLKYSTICSIDDNYNDFSINYIVKESSCLNILSIASINTIGQLKTARHNLVDLVLIFDKNFYDYCKLLSKPIMKSLEEVMNEYNSLLDDKEIKIIRLRYGYNNEKPKTLEEVGNIFSVTRERIRQIEAKGLRKARMIAEKNKTILNILFDRICKKTKIIEINDIEQYINNNEISFIISVLYKICSIGKCKYNVDYECLYNSDYEFNDIINEKLENISMFLSKQQALSFTGVDKIIFNNNYKEYHNIYIRKNIYPRDLFIYVIKQNFPNGYKCFTGDDYSILKRIIFKDVGEIDDFPSEHSLASMIDREPTMVQCNRGTFIDINNVNELSDDLYQRIIDFIYANKPVVYYSTILDKFKYELKKYDVENQYLLKGPIDRKLPEDFYSKRDYISVGDKSICPYDKILEIIKSFNGVFSINDLRMKISGVEDYVFYNILYHEKDNGLIFLENKRFIYFNKLNINDEDKLKLKNIIEEMFKSLNSDTISARKVYARIKLFEEKYNLNLEMIDHYFDLYSVIQLLFPNDYYYSRPFISTNPNLSTSREELLRNHLINYNSFTNDDVKSYLSKMNVGGIYSYLMFMDNMSDNFVQVDIDKMIKKEFLGINDETLRNIKKIINLILNNFKEIDTRTFNGYGMFPKLKYNWNKYLLVGIVRTYLSDDFAIDYTDNTYRTTDFIIRRDSNE